MANIKSERKLEIIGVSIDLIKEFGFDSFSYKDLSEKVGITKATLHHHFPKKEDLGVAVCTYLVEALKKLVETIDSLETFDEKIEFLLNSKVVKVDNKDICLLLSLQSQYNVIPDSMKPLVNEFEDLELKTIISILNKGIEEKRLTEITDVRSAGLVFLTSFKGYLAYSRSNDKIDRDDFKKVIFSIIK